MNVKFTLGSVVLALLIGMSGAADARDQIQLRIDKDGLQFGASLDPRQHGYEHAYRGVAGQYGQIYGRTEENSDQWQHPTDPLPPGRDQWTSKS